MAPVSEDWRSTVKGSLFACHIHLPGHDPERPAHSNELIVATSSRQEHSPSDGNPPDGLNAGRIPQER